MEEEDGLPIELQARVMRCLSLRDLARASGVCRWWRTLAHLDWVVSHTLSHIPLFRHVLPAVCWLCVATDYQRSFLRECWRRVIEAVRGLGFDDTTTAAALLNININDSDDPAAHLDETALVTGALAYSSLLAWMTSSEDGDPATQPRINMAAVNGETAKLMVMLRCGADPNCENRVNGTTTLMCAAANGQTETVRQLVLFGGAEVNKSTVEGVSALMYTAQNGHAETARVLVESGADVNQHMSDGMTSLYFAAQDGHTEVLKQLLASGATPDAKTTEGVTPLIAACTYGHLQSVRALLQGGANPNAQDEDGWTPLLVSLRFPEVVSELLFSGASPDIGRKEGTKPLLQSAQNGYYDTVSLLLEAGAAVDGQRESDNSTPLMHASEQGHGDIVTLLLQAGADPNRAVRGGVTALILAVESGQTGAVSALLEGHADPNKAREDGTTPLIYAATYGHRETAALLLAAGADPNKPRVDGISALMYASERPENDGLVADLLQAGANPNAVSKDGYTSFFPVVMAGNTTTAEILRRWGADPDLAIVKGHTSLVYAVNRLNMPAIKLLMECGANPNNTSSQDGRTALMEAADIVSPEIVKFLLNAGANPNLADSRGRTALMFASKRVSKAENALEVAKLLLDAGANVNASTPSTKRTALLSVITGSPCSHKSCGHSKCDPNTVAMAKLLLAQGADPLMARQDNVTPLMSAARSGCRVLVGLLLSQTSFMPAQLTMTACNCWTALHFAASCCHTDCVKALLEAGADPNSVTSVKKTSLFLAVETCCRQSSPAKTTKKQQQHSCICRDTVLQLLGKKANVNTTSILGNTVLMTALRHLGDHSVVLDLLLDAGACVVHVNKDGCGALMVAASLASPWTYLTKLLQRIPTAYLNKKLPAVARWYKQQMQGSSQSRVVLSPKQIEEATAVLSNAHECHSAVCPQYVPALIESTPTASNTLSLHKSRSSSLVSNRSLMLAASTNSARSLVPNQQSLTAGMTDRGENKLPNIPSIPAQKARIAGIARIYGVPLPSPRQSPPPQQQQTAASVTPAPTTSFSRFPPIPHH